MTTDEALATVAGVDIPTKPTEADLESAGLTTGVLVLLAALWSLLGHYLSSRSRYLSESGTACLLGLAAGVALLAWKDTANAGLINGLLRFNSAAFFTYLLPPVIFYAGLSVEQRLFFSNLPSILSFGVLGTLLSFVLMSGALYSLGGKTFGLEAQDCLALGAVFAATDSVAVLGLLDPRTNPQLFSLVFGEGIVNDATSVVLLGALARMARQQQGQRLGLNMTGELGMDGAGGGGDGGGGAVLELAWRLAWNFGYLLLTSTLLGFAAGAGVTALLRGRVASQGPHHEVALVGLLSYLAYLAAEVLGLSAILSLFCCGATVSHFALRNSGSGGGGGGGCPEYDPSGHHRGLPSLGSDGGADDSVHGGVDVSGVHHAATGTANGDIGVRSRYTSYMPVAAADYVGDHEGSAAGGEESGGAAGGVSRSMLWVLAAPAKRLVARAFGEGPGGGCMSPAGASTTINAFRSLSHVAEGLIFLYLGMDCLDPVRWKASYPGEVVWLVGILLFFLLATRAASVIPLSLLHNLYAPRHQHLSGRDILVIWWSGLMRGAVSVALVYLNFDTLDGSIQFGDTVIVPHKSATVGSGDSGGSGRLRRRSRGLLQSDGASTMPIAARGDAANATSDPATAVALALAAAFVDADGESAHQHATLIVSTLLVVVASVLVVSTLTKPVLQAAMEADPRKPPLRVLSEALFDPWVDATWRLKVALSRSYRRWTGSSTTGNAAPTSGGGVTDIGHGAVPGSFTVATAASASASSNTRRGSSSSATTFLPTHTIPMASLGPSGIEVDLLARGHSMPNIISSASAAFKANFPGLAATGAGPSTTSPFAAVTAAARSCRAANLQQRSGAAAAAVTEASTVQAGSRSGSGSGSELSSGNTTSQSAFPRGPGGGPNPSPTPGAAQLQHRAGGGSAGSGNGIPGMTATLPSSS